VVQIINSIDFDKIIQTKIDRKKDRSTLRRPAKLQGDLQNSQKNGKGRLIISDLVSDKEIQEASINAEKWNMKVNDRPLKDYKKDPDPNKRELWNIPLQDVPPTELEARKHDIYNAMLEDPDADKSRLLQPLYLVRAVKDKT
jgi:hypothetical protein